ncbi:MAG: type IV pilus assembly protein PilM [Candidatus Hydrogenedentota bacterium]
MALVKRGRSKRLVLDIGSSSIRLCELAPTKTGYQLSKYLQRDLQIDPASDEDTKRARRKEVIEALLRDAKSRHKKVILAVPGQSVFTRNRPLPPVPEYKVTQIVKYEIQQQIPFSLDQIALDYQVLDRTEGGGYDVMMAAIKVDVVEKTLEILDKSKRRIDIVDVSPLAAYNWLRHTGEFGDEGVCVALIDLGATTTDIVIQKDNFFRFTRSLNVGGNDITKAIASAFNLKWEEAEKVKRERGFAPTGDPARDGKGGEVIGGVLTRLVSEINRSFAYFRSQPGGGPVSRAIITGGGACLRNIIPHLQSQLNLEVRIAQPLAGLAIAPQAQDASQYPEQSCVVLGLALRSCQQVPIQINLIPPRVLEATRRREQAFYWVLSIATMLLIMASIIPVTAAKDEIMKDQIDALKRVLAQYDPALINDPAIRSEYEDELEFVDDEIKQYQLELERMSDRANYRSFWLKYIGEINEQRPRGGGIVLSSTETAVIGGDNNTGEVFRNAAASVSLAAAAGGNAQLGGAASPASAEQPYDARGFPGVYPAFPVAARGARGPKPGPEGPIAPVEPNGFILYGYAQNIEVLREFESNLRSSDLFLDDGVYLHVGLTRKVPDTDLDKAEVGGKNVGNRGAASSSDSDSGGGSSGSFGGLGNLANSGSATASGPTNSRGVRAGFGIEVYSFRLDVQFAGKPVSPPAQDTPGGQGRGVAATSVPTSFAGLGGFGGNQ